MPERIFLIDGMSQIYRAYHAIRDLTNKHGMATNAVYGFTTMLRRLINEESPDYLAVAMESKGKTFRHQRYQDYKANRARMPDDLAEQIPYVLRVCQVLHIPVLSYEGYEADDVIGTLACKAQAAGHETVILTIDKDLFQLVNDHIRILDPRTMTYLDAAKVEDKMGVPPERIIDYLALVGDASDNIPGAPGIGAKGAAKLIASYGSLDKLLEDRATVSHKAYRESLKNNREQILNSRELVTIECDLDIPLDMQDLHLSDPDDQKAFELFTELGFKSLIEDFVKPVRRREVECLRVEDEADLRRLTKQVEGRTVGVAFDYPDGDEEASLLGMALSWGQDQAHWIPASLAEAHPQAAGDLWSAKAVWAVHDLKLLTLQHLRRGGRPPLAPLDTMLMGYLLEPNNNDFSLETLAADWLGQSFESEGLLFEAPEQESANRACVTAELCAAQYPGIEEQGLTSLLHDIEIPLVDVLAAMEALGVKVDVKVLGAMSQEVGQELSHLTERIYAIADQEFNINSPRQLAQVLFERLQLPVVKKTRKAGHYSTSVEVLEKLAEDHEVARLVLEFREASKLKSTYLDTLPLLVDRRSGRLHTSYNQMVAATGRLSSSNPNLQNIPIKSERGRRIRRGFVAEPGYKIFTADYSQIELRVMAHLSQDRVLLESFRQGEDIHERTAREVFGMNAVMDPARFRRHAKVINFGIMYGLSAFGLAQNLKIERKEAQRFIDDYFAKYEGVRNWIDKTLQEVRATGQVVTLFGRIRQIPELRSKNRTVRSFGERTAINAPIQGTAADLIKVAMVEIHREIIDRDLKSRMIMQVHDELVFEVEQNEIELLRDLVVRRMEGAAELSVPLKVDLGLGETWYDAK